MEYGGSPPKVKEVIVMQDYVTYENLFVFTEMLVAVISLCYLIFRKKK